MIITAIRNAFGKRKYRITSEGEIHVFAVMPNTNTKGWYLFGYVCDAHTERRIEEL